MCNLSRLVKEEGRAEGMAEGREQTTLSALQNLINIFHFNVNDAMRALNVPESEMQKYLSRLSQAQRK